MSYTMSRNPTFAAVPSGQSNFTQLNQEQNTLQVNTNQNEEMVVRALHSPHSFGRYEGHESHQNLPEGSILQEETSKTEQSGEGE